MNEQQNVPQPKRTTWWNHSCYTGIPWLSALHCLQQLQSGACSTWSSQPLSLTQESNVSTPSGSTPNPQPSLHSVVSPFTLGLTRDVRTQTVSLCSVPSTHHATTADASTQLSTSEFLQLCFTKHPFRCTVPPRLHEDLREAQTPSNTGNPREVTTADAATQLSFAEFLERCILCRALPPRPSPAPLCFRMDLLRLPHTAPLSHMHPPNSRSQSSFLGASTPMTRWIDSLPFLRMGTSVVALHFTIPSTWIPLSVFSSSSGGDARIPVPRAQLNHQDSRFNLPWVLPMVSLVKQRPCDPVRNFLLLLPRQPRPLHLRQRLPYSHRLVPPKCEHIQLVLHLQKECQSRPSGNPLCYWCRPTCWTWSPRPVVLPMVSFGQSKPAGLGHIHNADSDLMHHQFRLSILQWNPAPARRNPTQIIAATCGRFHAVILQGASDHVLHITDQFIAYIGNMDLAILLNKDTFEPDPVVLTFREDPTSKGTWGVVGTCRVLEEED